MREIYIHPLELVEAFPPVLSKSEGGGKVGREPVEEGGTREFEGGERRGRREKKSTVFTVTIIHSFIHLVFEMGTLTEPRICLLC